MVMEQAGAESQISTIVLRGSTMNTLDDFERAIDDGVHAVKTLNSDKRLVAGAGAVEIECAQQLAAHALTTPGLEQYAIKKFAEALEVVPRTLAENSGKLATDVISELYVVFCVDDDDDVTAPVLRFVFIPAHSLFCLLSRARRAQGQ